MGKDLKGREIGKGLCQRKDGRYVVRLTLPHGKPISRYFDNQKKAERWLIDVKYDIEHGNISASTQMKLDVWYDYWLNTLHGENIRYNTRRNYESYYRRRIKDVIGDMVISEIKPLHCMAVLNECKIKGDSYGSMVKTRAVMSSLFSTACENGIIKVSPVTRSVKAAKTPKKERTVFTVDQQKEFLKLAECHSHYEEFVFVLNTGLRAGELQGLKWSDVDMKNRTIHVRRTMVYNQELRCFQENDTKTQAGDRVIPLTDIAFSILKNRKRHTKKIVNIDTKDYVFLNSEGKITPINTYNKILKTIITKMGIESYSMHNLRHTFATRCIEQGMQPKILQKILGHERIAMTMDLYVHITGDIIREEMDKVNFAL